MDDLRAPGRARSTPSWERKVGDAHLDVHLCFPRLSSLQELSHEMGRIRMMRLALSLMLREGVDEYREQVSAVRVAAGPSWSQLVASR